MATRYRLEISVQQLHDVKPHELSAFVSGGCELVVNFLEFPEIVIQPQSAPAAAAVDMGGAIAYNTCHTAEFEADPAQMKSALPTDCRCSLRHARHIQWCSPCPLAAASASADLRSYSMTNTHTSSVVGYAHMSCRVIPATATTGGEVATTVAPAPPPPPPPHPAVVAPQQHTTQVASSAHQAGGGKPYIVRVIVDDSNAANRHSGASSGAAGGRTSKGKKRPNPKAAPLVNTAAPESLLYVLQYDVAYQLQSTSEFLATTLRHDIARLDAAAVTEAASALTGKIDSSVERIVRLSNIVLQIANQLIENSPAPAQTGTTRDIAPSKKQQPDSAVLVKRNPVNKLPTPKRGTVAYFLTYNVLFQLQCVGSNLFYLAAAYHDALEVPLSAVPKQHAEFVEQLAAEVQRLTHQVNIMIQSAIDDRLGRVEVGTPHKHRSKSKDEKGGTGKTGKADGVKSTLSSASLKGGQKSYSSVADSRSSASSRSSSRSSLSSLSSTRSRPFKSVSSRHSGSATKPGRRSTTPTVAPKQEYIATARAPASLSITPPPLPPPPPPPPQPDAEPQPRARSPVFSSPLSTMPSHTSTPPPGFSSPPTLSMNLPAPTPQPQPQPLTATAVPTPLPVPAPLAAPTSFSFNTPPVKTTSIAGSQGSLPQPLMPGALAHPPVSAPPAAQQPILSPTPIPVPSLATTPLAVPKPQTPLATTTPPSTLTVPVPVPIPRP